MDKQVVFWWIIPCEGMINVLKAYTENIDKSAIVVTGALNDFRKSMGWDDHGKMFENHILLHNEEEWTTRGVEILMKYRDRLHVINAIRYAYRIDNLLNVAIRENIRFCNMTEAYINLCSGWKRILKNVYYHTYLPVQARRIARHSSGVICLSGKSDKDLNQFRRFGFKSDRIFPFGYFTKEKPGYSYERIDDKVHIICPGRLNKYKGVDILIKALGIVRDHGVSGFICHITGQGDQLNYLKYLVSEKNLSENILFEGVLDSEKYDKLLSFIDILVAPGRVEPWGIRINEAIQRGNAVIVSDQIGASELIEESGGGDIFKSGNAADLATKLEPLIVDRNRLNQAKQANIDFRYKISCEYQAEILHKYLSTILS